VWDAARGRMGSRSEEPDTVTMEAVVEPASPRHDSGCAADAEAALAHHEAATARLRLSAAEAEVSVGELAHGDRVCWAAAVTGFHVFALRYYLGGDATRLETLCRPLLATGVIALVVALLRPRAPAPVRGPGRGGFFDTVWFSGYAAQRDEPVFASLELVDARRALARKRRADSILDLKTRATPGSSVPRSTKSGDRGTWENADPADFSLRGADYLRDKRKYASAPDLYEPFAFDTLRSCEAVFDLPARAALPAALDHESGLPAWCPRILCQNMVFPGTPPPLFGRPPSPGCGGGPKGWQIVCWWRIKESTARAIRDDPPETWPPHLKLWQYYATHAETASTLNGALKGVARVENIGDASLGLPRLLHQFNAKPVLMAATALIGERPGVVRVSRTDDYYEFGLDVGADFAATSNHALFKLLPKFHLLKCDVGWLVEGRSVADLPEGILACMRLNYVDLNDAVDVDDWLAGTGKRD